MCAWCELADGYMHVLTPPLPTAAIASEHHNVFNLQTPVTKDDHLKRVQHSSSMTGMPNESSPNAVAMNSSAEFQHETSIRKDSLEFGQPPGHQWQGTHRNNSFVRRSAFISIPNLRVQSNAGKGPTAGPTATRVTATSVVTILKNHIIIRGAERNPHGCHELLFQRRVEGLSSRWYVVQLREKTFHQCLTCHNFPHGAMLSSSAFP